MTYEIKVEHFIYLWDKKGKKVLVCPLFCEERGKWIPHDFANMFPSWCTEEERNILANPENEGYLTTWVDLCNTFTLVIDDKTFKLVHDRDLYLQRSLWGENYIVNKFNGY